MPIPCRSGKWDYCCPGFPYNSQHSFFPTATAEPGAYYIGGTDDGILPVVVRVMTDSDENPWASIDVPVATPVEAHCVAAHTNYDHQNPSFVQQDQSVILQAPQYADPMNKSARESATVLGDVTFTRHPCVLPECPHCHCQSRTKVVTYPNLMTWFAAIVLLVIFWPICWIPLVMEQVRHSHYLYSPTCR